MAGNSYWPGAGRIAPGAGDPVDVPDSLPTRQELHAKIAALMDQLARVTSERDRAVAFGVGMWVHGCLDPKAARSQAIEIALRWMAPDNWVNPDVVAALAEHDQRQGKG